MNNNLDEMFKALSEKSAIFFWLPAPYCMTAWVLVISIWAAKSSTIFCSWGSNKLESMKIKYDRAESNINKICKVMEEHQVTLLKDAAMLDKM